MTAILRCLCLSLLCLLVSGCDLVHAPAATTGPLVLPPQITRLSLDPWLDLLPADTLVTADMLTGANPGFSGTSWQRLQGGLHLGLDGQPRWLRLQIRNAGPTRQLNLEIPRATVDQLDLFTRDAQGHWQHLEEGTQSLHHNPSPVGFTLPLLVPAGDSVHYLRLESTFPIFGPLNLSTPETSLHLAQSSACGFWLWIGLLAGVGLLPLFLPPRQGAPEKLGLAGMYLAVILYALCDRGMIGNWWLAVPGVQHACEQIAVMMINVAATAFVTALLIWRQQLPRLRQRVMLGLLLTQAVGLMLGIVAPTLISSIILLAISILTTGALLVACTRAWHQHPARDSRLMLWVTSLAVTRLLICIVWFGHLPVLLVPYELMLLWATLTLPLAMSLITRRSPAVAPPVRVAAAASMPADSGISPAPLVLVVEDNLWVMQVITSFLQKLGCAAHGVRDGEAALDWLKSEERPPALILMDCDLPVLDGLSTTQQWRQHEHRQQLPMTPIIGITAYVSSFQRERMLAAGMNDCLDKPVSMNRLSETLAQWLPASAQGSIQGSM